MGMKNEDFLAKLQTALVESNLALAKSLCADGSNTSAIQDHLWEIVPTVLEYITDDMADDEPNRFEGCVEILNLVAEKCSADDVVLVLHKELSGVTDEKKFVEILKPLKNALIALPKTKIKFAVWCFDAIQTFLNNVPVPDDFNLTDKERLLMDADPDVYGIIQCYAELLEFYLSLIRHYKTTEHINIVIKYVLQLYGKPMVFLDMEYLDGTSPEIREIAECLIKEIATIYNPYKFILWTKFHRNDKEEEDLNVEQLALANYSYLVVNSELAPKVYDNTFMLQTCLKFIAELFSHDNQFVVDKGLKLAGNVFDAVKGQILSNNLLEDPVHAKFCNAISNVIIYSSVKEYRQIALAILKDYILSFDDKGKFLIILNMKQTCAHTGLTGYLTQLYKELLADCFKEGIPNVYFSGTNFKKMLDKFCHLPKKEQSDLLEQADQIIPTLNLLRYLAIIDKTNLTGIKDLFEALQNSYFEPLKKGLAMSKAHYGLKIRELEDEAAKGDKQKEAAEVSVKIGKENLPGMSVGQEMNVIKSSITAFDVIESLLMRLLELIENMP